MRLLIGVIAFWLLGLAVIALIAPKQPPQQYRLCWLSFATGAKGHGDWFKDYDTPIWRVSYENRAWHGEIIHWVEFSKPVKGIKGAGTAPYALSAEQVRKLYDAMD